MDNVEIVVEMNEGERSRVKILRFDESKAKEYKMKSMCCDIKELFPHISKKGLEIELYHVDELAGRVTLESDHDLVESLENFVEERKGRSRKEHLTLHAVDCMTSLPTPCTSSESTRKSAKRKVIVTE